MSVDTLTERAFAEAVAANGGRLYRVGGCVRDIFMGVPPQDIDFCVVGMVKKNFKALFPAAEECGKAFPVFRLLIDGQKCEVAFARTERKVGTGYTGFKIASNPRITIQEDLFRRDTTVNSIAIDCLTGEVIDPFGGRADIGKGLLRATSSHFAEDPIRALRLAGQAARLGFNIEGETLKKASTMGVELAAEPAERILAELRKVLTKAEKPSRFFRVLAAANLLSVTFPEMDQLCENVFETAMSRLDSVAAAASTPVVRFAVLGLSLEPDSLACWNCRMTLPGSWLNAALAAGMVAKNLSVLTPAAVVDAVHILRRGALSVEDFDIVSKAAGLGIPPLRPLKEAMAGIAPPPDLKGREAGEWLRQRYISFLGAILNIK